MKPIPQGLQERLADLEQDALIDLWSLDLSKIGGGVLRLCNHTNELGESVTYAKQVYRAYPIRVQGVSTTGEGASNRPTLNVANLLGTVTALAENYHDVLGARVVRRQVCKRHLDAVNFASGSNPEADPQAALVSQWLIERLSHLDNSSATFELAAPDETDAARLPGTTVNARFPTLIFPGLPR